MMGRETRIFLAVDDAVDHGAVRAALPNGSRTQVATLEEASKSLPALLGTTPFDVLLVGCA